MRNKQLNKLQQKVLSLDVNVSEAVTLLNLSSASMTKDNIALLSALYPHNDTIDNEEDFKKHLNIKLHDSIDKVTDSVRNIGTTIDEYNQVISEQSTRDSAKTDLAKLETICAAATDIHKDITSPITVQLTPHIASLLLTDTSSTISIKEVSDKIQSLIVKVPVIKAIFNNQLIVSMMMRSSINCSGLAAIETISNTKDLTTIGNLIKDLVELPVELATRIRSQIGGNIPTIDDGVTSSIEMISYIKEINNMSTSGYCKDDIIFEVSKLVGMRDTVMIMNDKDTVYPKIYLVPEKSHAGNGTLTIDSIVQLKELTDLVDTFTSDYDVLLKDISVISGLLYEDIRSCIHLVEDMLITIERSEIPPTLLDFNPIITVLLTIIAESSVYLADSLELIRVLDYTRYAQLEVANYTCSELIK